MSESRRATRSSTRKRQVSPEIQPVPTKAATGVKKQKKKAATGVKKQKKKPAETNTDASAQTSAGSDAKQTEIHEPTADADAAGRNYWLLKAEPETRIENGKDVKFSIDDLAAMNEPAGWDGVRNYGARNNLKAMKSGDLAFFYHSNCKEPGIVGVMEVVQEASVDETAFDAKEPYYDPKSSRDNPKWYLVHVEFRRKFQRLVGLQELKRYKEKELKELPLLKMSRLSVGPVPKECWEFIERLEKLPIGE